MIYTPKHLVSTGMGPVYCSVACKQFDLEVAIIKGYVEF